MILVMAQHSNHYRGDLSTTQQLESYLAQYGWTLKDLVEECRDKEDSLPFLENLIPSGSTVYAGVGTVTYTDSEGNEVARFEGEEESGTLAMATDWAFLEKAADDVERALDKMSYVEFLSSVANGVASVEAYIFQKAYQYNIRNPGNELEDTKQKKVSFEDKIDKWIPIMTGGTKLNKGGKNWAHFLRLKQVRDTQHAHTKTPALNITFRELCTQLNLFRTGIAGLLLDLHRLFGDTVPSIMVKYAFHPEIKLVTVAEEAQAAPSSTPSSTVRPVDADDKTSRKMRDYEHRFENEGMDVSCRIRVYDGDERPIVIATQRHAPGGPIHSSIINAAEIIAADLIKDGTLSEFHMGQEIREESVRRQTLKLYAEVAPFVFVEEYLEPRHQLSFLWFDSYEILGLIIGDRTQEQIGNPYRQDTTRDEVETLIGVSSAEEDPVSYSSLISEELQDRLRAEIESYFQAYYSALKDLTAAYLEGTEPSRDKHGFAAPGAVPDFYRGAKDVRTFFCKDGVAVVHFPARTRQYDAYSFEDRSWAMVQGVVRAVTPPFPNGDRVGMLSYEPGEDFCADSASGPMEVWDPGPEGTPATYSTAWTRLDWAHKNHLDRWQNSAEARQRAREDLRRYIPES